MRSENEEIRNALLIEPFRHGPDPAHLRHPFPIRHRSTSTPRIVPPHIPELGACGDVMAWLRGRSRRRKIEVCETGVVDGLAEAQGVVRNLRKKKGDALSVLQKVDR